MGREGGGPLKGTEDGEVRLAGETGVHNNIMNEIFDSSPSTSGCCIVRVSERRFATDFHSPPEILITVP